MAEHPFLTGQLLHLTEAAKQLRGVALVVYVSIAGPHELPSYIQAQLQGPPTFPLAVRLPHTGCAP